MYTYKSAHPLGTPLLCALVNRLQGDACMLDFLKSACEVGAQIYHITELIKQQPELTQWSCSNSQ